MKLIVRTVNDVVANGTVILTKNEISRNKLQIPVLLGAIEEFQFDCAIGGARRDEEKARAKERFFSFRDMFGQWDPKNQRPEIWNLYNGKLNPGENMRVFPALQLDGDGRLGIHQKRKARSAEHLFQHERECFKKGGQWLPVPPPHTDPAKPDPFAGARPKPNEPIKKMIVRVRTIADMISTGMIESKLIRLTTSSP